LLCSPQRKSSPVSRQTVRQTYQLVPRRRQQRPELRHVVDVIHAHGDENQDRTRTRRPPQGVSTARREEVVGDTRGRQGQPSCWGGWCVQSACFAGHPSTGVCQRDADKTVAPTRSRAHFRCHTQSVLVEKLVSTSQQSPYHMLYDMSSSESENSTNLIGFNRILVRLGRRFDNNWRASPVSNRVARDAPIWGAPEARDG